MDILGEFKYYLIPQKAKYLIGPDLEDTEKRTLDNFIQLFEKKNRIIADAPIRVKQISPKEIEFRPLISQGYTKIDIIDKEFDIPWEKKPFLDYISTEIEGVNFRVYDNN